MKIVFVALGATHAKLHYLNSIYLLCIKFVADKWGFSHNKVQYEIAVSEYTEKDTFFDPILL